MKRLIYILDCFITALVIIACLQAKVNAAPKLFKSSNGQMLCVGDNDQQLYSWQLVDTNFDNIGDTWYYFDPDNGNLQKDKWTTEGYYLDKDGKWLEVLGCASDYTTEGFKFASADNTKFTYLFKDYTRPFGTWVLLSPLKNHVYYWFFFDYNGVLQTGASQIQGKYSTDIYGRWLNEQHEVVSVFIYDDDVSKYNFDGKFTDANGTQQSGIIYNNGVVISDTTLDNTVVYAPKPAAQIRFVQNIYRDSAKNCDFEIKDRNFYDEWATDHKGILKGSIKMNGTSSSFRLNTKKWNYYKFTYAIENDGTKLTFGDEGKEFAVLQVLRNGEIINEDPDVYTSSSVQISTMEVQTDKNDVLTVLFVSGNSNINLIITAECKSRKDAEDDDYIDLDNNTPIEIYGSQEEYGPAVKVEQYGGEFE